MAVDFEKAFEHFLDRREYDAAENALFSMVRISFVAGWLAAGGDPPKPQKIIELRHKDVTRLLPGIDTDLKPE